ncbi:MAG TPA: ABC transporter permease [Ruminococcaceae bacterium]|nr:ABC transporter permease [Oscillospiraceae bacterium]
MKMNKNQRRAEVILLAPFTVLFLMFTVLPIISSIALSFTYFNMVDAPKFIGIDNYVRMFADDSVFFIAVKNTLIFALITGPLGYAMSFIFAWMINDFGRGMRSFLTMLFYAPTLAGNVFFIWLFIFSGDSYGLVNSFLMKYGIILEPIQWLTDSKYSMGVVILVMLWLSLGAGFLSFIAGFQNLNRECFEAGAIDGIRNRWQELWYITVPQMAPQMMFAAVMTISSSFAVGYQCMELTGFPSTDYSTHTILLHILDVGTIRFDMGYASALAVILFGTMVLMWKIISSALSRVSGD